MFQMLFKMLLNWFKNHTLTDLLKVQKMSQKNTQIVPRKDSKVSHGMVKYYRHIYVYTVYIYIRLPDLRLHFA